MHIFLSPVYIEDKNYQMASAKALHKFLSVSKSVGRILRILQVITGQENFLVFLIYLTNEQYEIIFFVCTCYNFHTTVYKPITSFLSSQQIIMEFDIVLKILIVLPVVQIADNVILLYNMPIVFIYIWSVTFNIASVFVMIMATKRYTKLGGKKNNSIKFI